MKNINKLGILCLLLGLISSCSQCQKPVIDNPIYIYTFDKTPELKTEDTKKLIDQFLGDKDPKDVVKSEENIVYYYGKDDVSARVEQDLKTGNFAFSKGMKSYMGNVEPILPSASESVKIAENYMRTNGFLPKNQGELTLIHQGGLRSTGVVNGNKAGKIIDKLITLTYGRVLDSLTVIGPGSKIIVNIGNKSEIVGMTRRWREFSPQAKKLVTPQEMISMEEATALAKKQIATEFGEKTAFTINSSGKAYFDNNGTILQPVYVFSTTITVLGNGQGSTKNNQPITYLCVIEALKNSPEPLRLTQIDPRAKETIKATIKGAPIDTSGNRKKNND